MKAKDAQNLALTELYSDQEKTYNELEKSTLETINREAKNKNFQCEIKIDIKKVTLPTLMRLVEYVKSLEYDVSFGSAEALYSGDKVIKRERTLTIKWPGKPADETWWESYGDRLGCAAFLAFGSIGVITFAILCHFQYITIK